MGPMGIVIPVIQHDTTLFQARSFFFIDRFFTQVVDALLGVAVRAGAGQHQFHFHVPWAADFRS